MELYGLTKPQLNQVVDKIDLEHDACKCYEGRAAPNHLIEEDLVSEEQTSIGSCDVEIKAPELKHKAHEQ